MILPTDVPHGGDPERAGDVDVRPLVEEDLEWLWHWNVEVVDPQWKHWDGPYFGVDDGRGFEEFAEEWRSGLMTGHRAVAMGDGKRAGFVSRFEEPPAGGGWWEVGIVLFQPAVWGRGVGRRALRLWTEETFAATDAQVVTLTTWGGNGRMIHCANAVGYRECGRIPQARSWQGRRWDSVTMALLRADWTG